MKAGMTWLQECALRKKQDAPIVAIPEVTSEEKKPKFNKVAYQRNYMRLYRAAKKLKEKQ